MFIWKTIPQSSPCHHIRIHLTEQHFDNGKLSNGWITTNKSIIDLSITSGNLELIGKKAFHNRDFQEMSRMELHHVNIKRFSEDAFFGLTSLKSLRVEGRISSFESSIFLPMQTTLTYLVLKGSININLNKLFTCQMNHLEYLELDGLQRSQTIQTENFRKTPNLTHLKIVNSRVSSLESNAFALVKKTLKTLNLSNNHFTSLNTSAFSVLMEANRSIKILLKDNKWLCNCHLKALTRMVAANRTNFDDPVCWKSGMLSGRRLADVLLPDCADFDVLWVFWCLCTWFGWCMWMLLSRD